MTKNGLQNFDGTPPAKILQHRFQSSSTAVLTVAV